MTIINQFIKNIVVCIVIINIVENLLITKEYEKYIKLFTGIIIIIILMSSGANILHNGRSESIIMKNHNTVMRSSIKENKRDIEDKVEKIDGELKKEIIEKNEETIKDNLYEKHNIKVDKISVKISKYGGEKISKIIVFLRRDDNTYEYNKKFRNETVKEEVIIEEINKYYDIEKEKLKIRIV